MTTAFCLTDYGEDLLLQALLPNGTAKYIALFTALPTSDAGTGGIEVSASGYVRKSHSAWTTDTSDGTKRKNNGAITFNALSADVSDVVGWGIYDASSGGNLLLSAELDTPQDFVSGDQPRFADGELWVSLD